MTTSLAIAVAVGFCLFGGAILGTIIGRRLPLDHQGDATKSVVSASMAVVGTMSALVIGLLISNGSTDFKARAAKVMVLGNEIVQLDTLLGRYGPGASSVRAGLRLYARTKLEDLFPTDPRLRPNVDRAATSAILNGVEDGILALPTVGERQTWLRDQALQLALTVNETQAELSRENVGSLPQPFVAVLVFWLTALFVSFGLFAPRNGTTLTAILLCAACIAMAIKLVADMNTPLDGRILLTRPPIHISGEPLRHAIESLGR